MSISLVIHGQTDLHVAELQPGVWIHKLVIEDLSRLQRAACLEGFDLQIVSAFRSFETQLKIWNEKCLGRRPVLDGAGQPIDISQLATTDLMYAILRWSALPGASRHHWGTDFDVIDRASTHAGQKVHLTAVEGARGGPFFLFNEWLEANVAKFNFYRPYAADLGGIALSGGTSAIF